MEADRREAWVARMRLCEAFTLIERLALTAALACLLLTGCGSDRPKTVPIEGKVTMDGGPMPAGGAVYFTPEEPAEGYPRRPGIGDFDTDGSFTVKTFDPGDGLIPGRYGVAFECWEVPPNMEGRPTKSYLAQKFQNAKTSEISLEISPDDRGPVEVSFDVSARK